MEFYIIFPGSLKRQDKTSSINVFQYYQFHQTTIIART